MKFIPYFLPPSSLPRETAAALALPLPVLSSTQVCLELTMQRRSVDVRAAVELLGRDPGAVLRIFSTVAREYPDPQDRPERLDDCIGGLTSHDLLTSLHDPPSIRSEQRAFVPFARHGAVIAYYACAAAASVGLPPDRARLIGLLHSLGTMPRELGRMPSPEPVEEQGAVARVLAQNYGVPAALWRALDGVHRADSGSVWAALICAAHDLAARHGSISVSRTRPSPANNISADS